MGLLLAAWAVVPHLPASQLVVTVGTLVGERLLYIPSVGLSLAAAAALYALMTSRAFRWTTLGAAAGLVVALAAWGTALRNRDWLDDEALFASALRVCPAGAKLHQQMGLIRLNQQRTEDGRQHFLRAADIYPEWCEPQWHLARVYAATARVPTAVTHLRRCARDVWCAGDCLSLLHQLLSPQLNAKNATAWLILAEAFSAVIGGGHPTPQWMTANAALSWREAAVIHLNAGAHKMALWALRRGLSAAPESCDLKYWRGITLARVQRAEEAATAHEAVLDCGDAKAFRASADELVELYHRLMEEAPPAEVWREKLADVLVRLLRHEARAAADHARVAAGSERTSVPQPQVAEFQTGEEGSGLSLNSVATIGPQLGPIIDVEVSAGAQPSRPKAEVMDEEMQRALRGAAIKHYHELGTAAYEQQDFPHAVKMFWRIIADLQPYPCQVHCALCIAHLVVHHITLPHR